MKRYSIGIFVCVGLLCALYCGNYRHRYANQEKQGNRSTHVHQATDRLSRRLVAAVAAPV